MDQNESGASWAPQGQGHRNLLFICFWMWHLLLSEPLPPFPPTASDASTSSSSSSSSSLGGFVDFTFTQEPRDTVTVRGGASCSSTARRSRTQWRDLWPSRGVKIACCWAPWWTSGGGSWLTAHCWCRMWCTRGTTGLTRGFTSASPRWTDWGASWVGPPGWLWPVRDCSIQCY